MNGHLAVGTLNEKIDGELSFHICPRRRHFCSSHRAETSRTNGMSSYGWAAQPPKEQGSTAFCRTFILERAPLAPEVCCPWRPRIRLVKLASLAQGLRPR